MASAFPPAMVPTVGSLVQTAQERTAAEFEAPLGAAVLVGPDGADQEAEEDDPWAFNTVSIGAGPAGRVGGYRADPTIEFE